MMMRSLLFVCVAGLLANAAAQSMPGMQHEPATAPVPQTASSSLSYPVQQVQEPEALDFRTGENLPVPELLNGVMTRPAMSLKQWLAFADTHQPSLMEARSAVGQAQAQARQVALPPNATVGYSGEHIRGGSYHGGEEGAFVSQEIVLGGKLGARRDAMLAEGRAREFRVEVQRARIHNDVAQRFYDTVRAQTEVTLRDRMLQQAMDAETNAHELMRVGQADAADVLKAEIAVEEAKIEFAASQRGFLASFARLAATAGQSSMVAAPVAGRLTDPPAVDVASMSGRVDGSPAVQQARAEVAAAEARLRAAKREVVPNVSVTAGEWYSGERLEGTQRAAGWMGFAQAGVQLPLWNRNQGGTAAAGADVSRAQASVVRTQLDTTARMASSAQQYEQARFAAERYRTQMLPRARRAYELEVMKYQQMGQSYQKVLDAQGMLYTLQLGYVNALHEEWSAAIALQNYALEGALPQPLSDATGMESTK